MYSDGYLCGFVSIAQNRRKTDVNVVCLVVVAVACLRRVRECACVCHSPHPVNLNISIVWNRSLVCVLQNRRNVRGVTHAQ